MQKSESSARFVLNKLKECEDGGGNGKKSEGLTTNKCEEEGGRRKQ